MCCSHDVAHVRYGLHSTGFCPSRQVAILIKEGVMIFPLINTSLVHWKRSKKGNRFLGVSSYQDSINKRSQNLGKEERQELVRFLRKLNEKKTHSFSCLTSRHHKRHFLITNSTPFGCIVILSPHSLFCVPSLPDPSASLTLDHLEDGQNLKL